MKTTEGALGRVWRAKDDAAFQGQMWEIRADQFLEVNVFERAMGDSRLFDLKEALTLLGHLAAAVDHMEEVAR